MGPVGAVGIDMHPREISPRGPSCSPDPDVSPDRQPCAASEKARASPLSSHLSVRRQQIRGVDAHGHPHTGKAHVPHPQIRELSS